MNLMLKFESKKIGLLVGVILWLSFGCSNPEDKSISRPLTVSEPVPVFKLLDPSRSGINFTNQLYEDRYRNIVLFRHFYNGGGVAIGDLDNDDLPEIFFTGNMVPNRLYHNQGNMRFKDATEAAGLLNDPKLSWAAGVTMADINQDGLLDIYVCRSGMLRPENRSNLLYINQGNLQFKEQAAQFGLDDPAYSVQAAFFDYDKDGDLDMYLLNNGVRVLSVQQVNQLPDKDPESGDKLFRNDNGQFTEVTIQAGIKSVAYGFGLGVAIGDLNNDNWDDIYVTNDFFEHDYIYINNQDGTFREVNNQATKHNSLYSMGNDIADFNNDGFFDLVSLDMVAEDNRRLKANMSGMNPDQFYALVDRGFHHQYMFNTLQLNQGNTYFTDIAQMAGIATTDWSWAPLFADFDNDGWQDLFVTNGLRKDARNTDFINQLGFQLMSVTDNSQQNNLQLERLDSLLALMPSEKIVNYMFQNQGDYQFRQVMQEWGLDHPTWSNGAAYGDLDNDGDLDLVVNNVDQPSLVYENQSSDQHQNAVKVRLKGPAGNLNGLGAKVILTSTRGKQYRQIYPSRGFQSSVENIAYFGLGSIDEVMEVIVNWPDGKVSEIKNPKVNHVLVVEYSAAVLEKEKENEIEPFFAEVDEPSVDFRHHENKYNDFDKEVLLPHKMSAFGPALAVGDVNGDGMDDFYAGGAAGQEGVLYLQLPSGNFQKLDGPWQADRSQEDLDAIFLDADQDGDHDLYVVSGGNEYPPDHEYYRDRLYLNQDGIFKAAPERLPVIFESGSCVISADMDLDGDLDLFIGSRVKPQHYPRPGTSRILINEDGYFKDETSARAEQLIELGLVTDALFTDFDQDQDPDLLLAGEWMPLALFSNDNGIFTNITKAVALDSSNGWWFSLAQADLDGDGDLDYIAGNLGLNYKYKASPEQPFEVYSDDFDQNGKLDIVLSYYNEGLKFPLRGRSCSSQQIPDLKKKFPTYNEFARATLSEVYGPQKLEAAYQLSAYTFASVYLENTDNGFIIKELPPMAQFSNINAILPADLNSDGFPDLVVAGNHYQAEVETARNDAGTGLVLVNIKGEGFDPIPSRVSGFWATGDVKSMTWLKINEEKNLLIGNNNGQLQIIKHLKINKEELLSSYQP